MKRTHDVNIGGTIFHIEEDAYQRLDAYLSAISAHFASYPDNTDIVADIEGRIAEQLLQSNGASRIVALGDVERVVAAMGQADQLGEDADVGTVPPAPSAAPGVGARRLFRDPDGKIIAGVAKGLATYAGVKPWVVRALFVAPWVLAFSPPFMFDRGGMFHLGWLLMLVYLALWLILPAAKTTTDKLLMRGNPVTLATVEQGVRDRLAAIAPGTRKVSTQVVTHAGSLVRLLVIGLARAAGVAAVGLAAAWVLACTIMLIIVLVNAQVLETAFPIDFLTQLHGWSFPFVLCSYLVVTIPFALAALIALATFRQRYHTLTRTVMAFTAVWLVSLFVWVGIWASFYPQYQQDEQRRVRTGLEQTDSVAPPVRLGQLESL